MYDGKQENTLLIYVPAQSSTGTFDQWPGSVGTLILIGLDRARDTGPSK